MSDIGFVLHGRYELVATIGKGGMSEVFLARDLNLASYWAVKKVENKSTVNFEAFKKEVELLASLSYPDIPRIVDRVEIGQEYYVVMDFIDGISLGRLVESAGPQEEKLVIEWGEMLCDVLEYLHTTRKNPIVYRDLKPDNVMLTQSGRVRLIDFGIAKECPRGEKYTGRALGTKGYAAPEQYQGGGGILDERTDIYALGATLFYLVTGVVPDKPPQGVPPLQDVLPGASEGLAYIIAKCTADDPDDRYQSVAQVRRDMNNIGRLTGAFRDKMRKRLTTFIAVGVACVMFLGAGFGGKAWVQADLDSTYQATFRSAIEHDRAGEYADASFYYSRAIDANPDDRETYVLLFNALLPHEGDDEVYTETKSAIDEMRKRYLDNERSPMYQDPQLLYIVAKRCVEVTDATYADYALDYFSIIQQSDAYAEGVVEARELKSYETVASFLVQQAGTDFTDLSQKLADLEAYTDEASLTPTERLNNYYTLAKIYSSYPASFSDAYNKALAVGEKARTILQSNMTDESLTFNNIVPLYQLIAYGQYNNAALNSEPTQKLESYKNSLQWFGYLDDLNVTLSEDMMLKKAGAYKGVFDVYRTPGGELPANEEAGQSLDMAIEIYKQVISANAGNFSARVLLTQCYIDKELAKTPGEEDFTDAINAYNAAKDVQSSSQGELSGVALMQFSALTSQMQSLGLEV